MYKKASRIISRSLCAIIAITYGMAIAEESPPADKPTSEKDIFKVQPFQVPDTLKNNLKDYRHTWPRLTGFDFSGLHWNQFVVIYVNKGAEIYKNNYLAYINAYLDEDEDEEEDNGEHSADENFTGYEPGTIFVKENFLASDGHPTTPASLTIMIKHKPGYDPKNGDWEYIQSNVNGEILVQGKTEAPQIYELCGKCHQNMADRDFIFSTYYSESSK